MTHHEFNTLSERYLAGNCSPEEIEMLLKWSDTHFTQNEKNQPFASASEAMEVEHLLWDRIHSTAMPEVKPHWIRNRWLWGSVAACFTLLLSYLYLGKATRQHTVRDVAVHGIETKNSASSQQKVTLPDGSVVTLAEHASIITEENYGKVTRTVYLTGEAFFDITHNEKMPFLVYTGDLVTEVLGTSFRIKPRIKNNTIEVSVKSGKVSVYAPNGDGGRKKNGVIVTPNQKALYDTESKTIRQDIVDLPEVILPHPVVSDFQFEEATISSVLKMMQHAYGVDILVGNSILNDCAFTGDLNGLNMYQQLEMVCGVVNAEYEIRGTTIFITGSGCDRRD
jgi:transmembrane sensor